MAKGVKRTSEEISQAFDEKIQYHEGQVGKIKEQIKGLEAKIKMHQSHIKSLNKKKDKALNPTPKSRSRKRGVNAVIAKAKEQGMTPQEMAEKLGISLD